MILKKIMIILLIIIILISLLFIYHSYEEYSKKPSVKIPILLYHDFVTTVPEQDPDNFKYINTPKSFEENIKTLIENGYTILSIQDLEDATEGNKNLPSKPILITFDDGYYSNYEYIFPILKKYNVYASIFVTTDHVGKTINNIRYLDWNNCLEMQNSGLVKIYSHSKRHVFYHKYPPKEVKKDVIESYKIIETNLGKKNLKAFAYPYGSHTLETVLTLSLSGIDMQFYDIGMNNFKGFNPHFIKRINIPCEMTGKEIIEEIER